MKMKKFLVLSLTLAGLVGSSVSASEPTTSEEAKEAAGVTTQAEFEQIKSELERLDQEYYAKDHKNVTRPADIMEKVNENKLDLQTAPDNISKISGVRVDKESNPILMYSNDPHSWGRHLLGDKSTSGGKLYLTTYGYTSTFTDKGDYGCAVPYYWTDVNKGDAVLARNLENQTYSISAARNDFGPNQKNYPDRILDLGKEWNNQLHGNGLTYSRTYVWIRGGDHY